jgi:hypothetical protein
MQRHAQAALHVAVAGDEQHGLARLQCADHGVRHGAVACDLNPRHRPDLRLGQGVAVAFPNALLLRLQRQGWQARVQRGVGHGFAQMSHRQVGAQHGHAGAHGGHYDGAIGFPRPTRVVPRQGCAHGGFAGAGSQVGRAVPLLGHFHRHRRQTALVCQPLHGLALQLLVVGRIVLFAQQQRVGRQQG